MKNFFLILIMMPMLFVVSCERKAPSIPSDVLPKDKMVAVLIDVQLAEAANDAHGVNIYQLNLQQAQRYDTLLQKHQVSFEKFKDSYNYYIQHPALLSDVYAEVVSRLTTMDAGYKASKKYRPATAPPHDSLPHSTFHP